MRATSSWPTRRCSSAPAPSRESYLVMDKIIAACKQTGAQAVHPGYGFLSENAVFARRVEDEGIVFIGPKHGSIAAMGDKIASKKLALAAKVNTIPGWNDAIETAERAVRDRERHRLSGDDQGQCRRRRQGPARGVERQGGLRRLQRLPQRGARRASATTASSSRSTSRNLVTSRSRCWVTRMATCVYLNERECSIQRRHQKVIEEAPSPFISEATRKAMGEQAVALARAVNYQSAGTVEFVVGRDQSFYFLEMNTRLQVEHPVTECITGLDLVEQMIRVAAGEKLGFVQADIPRRGWAMECRINAEDPFRSFLPSTGRLVKYQPPAQTMEASLPVPEGGGVRVDTGVYEGGEIPMYYDSMIAKLIVHGLDRDDAIRRMREALNAFVIRGVSSNIPFQAALLAHPKFVAGDFNTGFIAEQYPIGFSAELVAHDDPRFLLLLAGATHRRMRERAARISGQLPGHELQIADDFVIVLTDAHGRRQQTAVKVGSVDGCYRVTIGGQTSSVSFVGPLRDIVVQGEIDGRSFFAQIERIGLHYRITYNGLQIEARVLSARAAELQALMPFKAPPDTSKFLLSPMPGLLVEVAVQAGQKVNAGEKLAVIEAMKMENILIAARDGTVSELLVAKGDSLTVDQPILSFA